MRDRHHPRLCRSCGGPMARQEDACWDCGAPWAADARPTTKPRLSMAAVVAVADGPSRTLLKRGAAHHVAG